MRLHHSLPLLVLPLLGQDVSFEAATKAWHKERVARLSAEGGWLSLVGLHWLSEGENDFGSHAELAVPLPGSGLPASAGSLVLEGGKVRLKVQPGSGLLVNGKPAADGPLATDESGKPDLLKAGRVTFFLLKRGDRFGVRAKDPESPARKSFKGIDTYAANPAFRIVADFIPHPKPRKVEMSTVIGTVETHDSPGVVRFTLHGKTYALEPVVEDPQHPELFFVFKDATSGRTTYPAGRFLYAAMPKDGKVILDFNRAYNPPCAFTPYATCPLAPKANRLDVAIEAGEKNYGSH